MDAVHLRTCLLVSVTVHIVLLWLFGSVMLNKPRVISPLNVGLLDTPAPAQEESSASQKWTGQASASLAGKTRKSLLSPPSITGQSSPAKDGQSLLPGGTAEEGVIVPGSQTISPGEGVSSGIEGKFSIPKEDSSDSRKAPRITKEPSNMLLEIPAPAIQAAGFQSSFDDGAIHPEVDYYNLDGINIPGTDVCIEGDQIRTKERLTFTRTITDLSRCRIVDSGGDGERVVCPPQAETKVVTFQGYLSSPLTYRVNFCLLYDKSNCSWRQSGDSEREVCLVNFKYEGNWAEGTIFDYKCAKSETRTYNQALQYNIRYFTEREIDNRMRRREVHRVGLTVPQCDR
jgi:hypothetical protein